MNNKNVDNTKGMTAPVAKHVIHIDGQSSSFTAYENHTLLAAMENAQQTAIRVGCRGGGCGQCRIRVLDGQYSSRRMSRTHISEEDESQNLVLACCTYARSDMTILPFPPDRLSARKLNKKAGQSDKQ